MKILVVTPKYYPDNFPIVPIVERFKELGHQITVLTSFPFDHEGNYLENFEELEIKDSLKIIRIKTKTRKKSTFSLMNNYLSVGSKLAKWAKKTDEQFDLVYTFAISPFTILKAGNVYKKKHHVKHYGHILDIWPDALIVSGYARKCSLLYSICYHWSKRLYKKLDLAVVGSPSFTTYLHDVMKLDNLPTSYVSQPGLIGKDKKEENPYHKHCTNILYCGNVSKTQLVDYIVPAMEKVNDKNIRFTIIGKGSYSHKLEEILKEKHVNVEYLGEINYENVYKYFAYTDAFFIGLNNKSYSARTIPNKFITSLYYAKPIIAMLEGDAKEILEKTKGGYVVEQSIDALVEAINKVAILSPKEKSQMGDNNKHYYLYHFTVNKTVDDLLNIFASK